MTKFNPKKNNSDRRKRTKKELPVVKFVAVETKSVNGVKHIKYKAVIPQNPQGYNRRELKVMLAKRGK